MLNPPSIVWRASDFVFFILFFERIEESEDHPLRGFFGFGLTSTVTELKLPSAGIK